jgi:uncharacterized damage-inducible protein DinB
VTQLAQYRKEFVQNLATAKNLSAGLTDEQFCWRPAPGAWSACENLLHLVTVGRLYMPAIDEAVAQARANGVTAPGPFGYSIFERWFIWMMEPPVRLKMRTPKSFAPAGPTSKEDVMQEFSAMNQTWLRLLEEIHGLDLKRIKISSPASARMKFSLAAALALNAAHERRHLWQAGRIVSPPEFPKRG